MLFHGLAHSRYHQLQRLRFWMYYVELKHGGLLRRLTGLSKYAVRFFDMQLQPDGLNVIPAQTCEVHYRLQNQKEWQQLQIPNRLADYYEPSMYMSDILLPGAHLSWLPLFLSGRENYAMPNGRRLILNRQSGKFPEKK